MGSSSKYNTTEDIWKKNNDFIPDDIWNSGSNTGQLYKVWCNGCSWIVYTLSIPLSIIVIGGRLVVYSSEQIRKNSEKGFFWK